MFTSLPLRKKMSHQYRLRSPEVVTEFFRDKRHVGYIPWECMTLKWNTDLEESITMQTVFREDMKQVSTLQFRKSEGWSKGNYSGETGIRNRRQTCGMSPGDNEEPKKIGRHPGLDGGTPRTVTSTTSNEQTRVWFCSSRQRKVISVPLRSRVRREQKSSKILVPMGLPIYSGRGFLSMFWDTRRKKDDDEAKTDRESLFVRDPRWEDQDDTGTTVVRGL